MQLEAFCSVFLSEDTVDKKQTNKQKTCLQSRVLLGNTLYALTHLAHNLPS